MPYSVNPQQQMMMQQMFGGAQAGMPPMQMPQQGGGDPNQQLAPSFMQPDQNAQIPPGVGSDQFAIQPPPTGDSMEQMPPGTGDPMQTRGGQSPMPPRGMTGPGAMSDGDRQRIAQQLAQVPPEARQRLVQALMQRMQQGGGM